MTEVELQLRLDSNGRTTFDPENVKSFHSDQVDLDYSSKVVLTSLSTIPHYENGNSRKDHDNGDQSVKEKGRDDLLFDCEISDCGLLPRTFWMPCKAEVSESTELPSSFQYQNLRLGTQIQFRYFCFWLATKPRCALEKMAQQVFYHHVPDGYVFDPTNSGSEWWIQIRPSPSKTGRYSLVHEMDKHERKTSNTKKVEDSKNNNVSSETNCDDEIPTGISFHWDKDEELRLMTGGSMYIHPHISTVTYLTDLGAPTMVLDCKVASTTGSNGLPDPADVVKSAFISWPKIGKHLSFDGRMLHAAPIDLMEKGEFERQCQVQHFTSSKNEDRINHTAINKEKRRKRRVTFLVNIWLNYRPFGVNPFPHTMIDKLSPVAAVGELFSNHANPKRNLKEKHPTSHAESQRSKHSLAVTTAVLNENTARNTIKTFTWPLGGNDSKERIKVEIPLSLTRSEMKKGGNVHIQWMSDRSDENIYKGVSFISEGKNREASKKTDETQLEGESVKETQRDSKRQKIDEERLT